jgi:hypothetical protein
MRIRSFGLTLNVSLEQSGAALLTPDWQTVEEAELLQIITVERVRMGSRRTRLNLVHQYIGNVDDAERT